MYELTIYDYLVLSLVLLVSIIIGFYHAIRAKWPNFFLFRNFKVTAAVNECDLNENKDNQQIREYLIASGSMSAFPIAFSLLASFFSATALLGFPAEVYTYGNFLIESTYFFLKIISY